MKRIAVLGASGFLGKPLCAYLKERKVRLYLCSRRGGHWKGLKIDRVDVREKGALQHWLKGKKVDGVFYLSAVLPNTGSRQDWKLLQDNLAMHHSVLECWIKQRFHLIYASSTAVYGHGPLPWKETSVPKPGDMYALSKLMGEQILTRGSRMEKLPLQVLRIHAPYGIKQDHKTVVNIFMENALKDADLELFGTGQRVQDFIYVQDIAQAFWKACMARHNGVYNIAGGSLITMRQLARAIVRITGSKSKIICNGRPDPQEKFKIRISTAKAVRELKFNSQYTLESGLRGMMALYRGGKKSR